MKGLRILAVLMVLLVVSAAPISAATTTITLNTQAPFERDVVVPCANGGLGETVHIAGTAHAVDILVFRDNGGFTGTSRAQLTDVTGVGLTTGTVYSVTGAGGTIVATASFGTASPYATTIVFNLRLSAPDVSFLAHTVYHETINADGTITSFFDKLNAECK